jgi:hypothetical protein
MLLSAHRIPFDDCWPVVLGRAGNPNFDLEFVGALSFALGGAGLLLARFLFPLSLRFFRYSEK